MPCFWSICRLDAWPPAAGKGKYAYAFVPDRSRKLLSGISLCASLFAPLPVLNWIMFIFFLGGYWTIAGIVKNPTITDLSGLPVGHDFVAFWAASELARHGDRSPSIPPPPSTRWNKRLSGPKIQGWVWNYPPTFLLMVLPLSLAPYLFSYAAWIVGTLCGYLGVIRRIAPHRLTPFLLLGFSGSVCQLFLRAKRLPFHNFYGRGTPADRHSTLLGRSALRSDEL